MSAITELMDKVLEHEHIESVYVGKVKNSAVDLFKAYYVIDEDLETHSGYGVNPEGALFSLLVKLNA